MGHFGVCEDKDRLDRHFRRDGYLHLYELGDLDPVYWPNASYYADEEDGELLSAVMIYRPATPNVLIALEETNLASVQALIASQVARWPRELYVHCSPGALDSVSERVELTESSRHFKMQLCNHGALQSGLTPVAGADLRALDGAALGEVFDLLDTAYPGHAFEPSSLAHGHIHGAYVGDRLVSFAGIHVCSVERGVAALGNITTHPDFRGRGLGRLVTAASCQSLLRRVSLVGLNVAADNDAAIRLYEKLGFRRHAEYEEVRLRMRDAKT